MPVDINPNEYFMIDDEWAIMKYQKKDYWALVHHPCATGASTVADAWFKGKCKRCNTKASKEIFTTYYRRYKMLAHMLGTEKMDWIQGQIDHKKEQGLIYEDR